MTPPRAIILAAGRGSRLGGHTGDRPKCLVPVGGRPLLEWQIDALAKAGVTSIAVVRGYEGWQLEGRATELFDNPRWAQTNMVRSLECAAAWLRESACIVSYSDIIYFESAVRQLIAAESDIAITFDREWRKQWEDRFGDPLIDAETFQVDGSGRVTDIGRKPTSLDQVNGQYMGLLKFTPAGWRDVESELAAAGPTTVDRLDMTSLLRLLIGRGVQVQGVGLSERWFEVDSPSDLELCEQFLSGGHISSPRDE